ncbi:TniQ family protein [Variovorax boronicumulans]|uniref:TniQ family protein n=1 Tax=Variovorax boronicumulans TaxID=436515 RepID=UPI00277EC145|nr:TniQ family protein [Variovorax boronicumulans]MDQ0042800.1 hypothetical protein [Variovorax boronicumulans]
MNWAFSVAAHPGELLSGYLCRTATAHGATPFSFMRAHLNDKVFWARDIDRGAVSRYESALGEASGLGVGMIRSMTLIDWMHALTPRSYAKRIPAIAPWINASGVFHRTRRLHALQFCSQCLAETGIVEKSWRLSVMVACPVHRTPLDDACPRCDAPFIPHRGNVRGYRCHACSVPLAVGASGAGLRHTTGQSPDVDAVEMQTSLRNALTRACDEGSSEALAELRACRVLTSVLLSHQHARATEEALHLGHLTGQRIGRQVETMRLAERHRVLVMCGRLLAGWPNSIRAIASATGLRQEAFESCGEMPIWLRGEVERLPLRKARRPGRAKRNLDERIGRLHEFRPSNWRAGRAALMLRAAQARR